MTKSVVSYVHTGQEGGRRLQLLLRDSLVPDRSDCLDSVSGMKIKTKLVVGIRPHSKFVFS